MGFWLSRETNTRGIKRFRTKMMNSLYGCIYTLINWVVLRYHLNDAILEEGITFNRAYGMTSFEYLRTNQRFKRVFNEAMSNHTTLIMKRILQIYKGFEGLKVLVDVGGGIGVTVRIITSKFPHIKGINYDMSHVLMDVSLILLLNVRCLTRAT